MGDIGKGYSGGRPETKGKKIELPLTVDLVTNQFLAGLAAYGRFGTSRQDVLLFILRSWLWEHESRLREAILSAEKPLGIVDEDEG